MLTAVLSFPPRPLAPAGPPNLQELFTFLKVISKGVMGGFELSTFLLQLPTDEGFSSTLAVLVV